MKEVKLHLGCGKRDFGADWFHIDNGDYSHLDYNIDVNILPFDDDYANLIYASHIIAYFDREEIIDVFKEWYRVLKPNGIIRIATPDIKAMSELFVDGKYPLENFLGPIFGKMEMGSDLIYHRTTYDFNSLKNVLNSVGFKDVKLYDWKKTEHSDFDDHSQAYLPSMNKENGTLISLNIEGIK